MKFLETWVMATGSSTDHNPDPGFWFCITINILEFVFPDPVEVYTLLGAV